MFTVSKFDITYVWEPEISPYCGPLYFASFLKSPVDVIANGSFGLVDTGDKKLLVTCNHVWDEFQKLREQNAALRMFICLRRQSPIVFGQEPIDHDKSLDIVTFDMKPLLAICSGNKFYRLDQNPARPVAKGDPLFFLGYPGYLRVATGKAVQFGRVPYAVAVNSVDGLRFHSNISEIKYEEDSELVPKSNRHGGISGSPCFLAHGKARPMQLVGFVNSLFINHLGFIHVRCLNRDGTIKKQLS